MDALVTEETIGGSGPTDQRTNPAEYKGARLGITVGRPTVYQSWVINRELN